MPECGGVLFVHAHPDDESMGTGGTIARLVAEGVRVDLVTCTDGAEGEIHDPTLDPDEARPRLAEIRAAELACSVEALGGGAIHQHLLGLSRLRNDRNRCQRPPRRLLAGRPGRPPTEPADRDRAGGAAVGDRHLRRERQLRPSRPHQRGAHRARGVHAHRPASRLARSRASTRSPSPASAGSS